MTIRLHGVLKQADTETHLILSEGAVRNIEIKTQLTVGDVEDLADHVYDVRDVGVSIASGSFKTDGMIVAPCTMKTLSGVANSYNENLIIRAADVILKERRKLLLMVRETPLHKGHLRLMMMGVADFGGIIVPPCRRSIMPPRP